MDRDSDIDKQLLTLYYLPLTLSLTSLLAGLYLAWRASYGINFLQWGFIATGLFLLTIFIMVDRDILGCLMTERQFMKIHFYSLLVAIPVLLCLTIAAFYSININPGASDGPDFFHMWGRTRVREYDIIDYDCELRRRMANKQYWGTIATVLRHDHVCDGMQPLCDSCKAGVLADIQRIWSQLVICVTAVTIYHAIQLPFLVKLLKFRKYSLRSRS
ncbi:hypothetical protein PR202_ga24589 [Eleusine coracana subsp. coracana]|uniref:Uncharacterized protein n=1 Tax=Eleusine coracana subsp. coracana TaxID=191504 RepID=A0AAV5D8X3_ELECO|nr:hypothetical protein PR202_ga24589 [Eleusine coracana subsp. coracana]